MLVAVCDDVYVDRCALQIRLDFDTFIITGPSTKTVTGTWITFPVESDDQVQYSNCGTDTFGVTNAPTLPVVCGTLTGEHGTIAIFQLFRVALKSHQPSSSIKFRFCIQRQRQKQRQRWVVFEKQR